MSASRPITIIGGGLAGLTLGIGLRQRGVPVTIQEAGHYPRHRVCGEFICGRGRGVLARLGLEGSLMAVGAREARTAVFHLGQARSPVRALAEPALCISRFALDAALAEQFRRTGGQLLEGRRWTQPHLGDGVVRASGRRLEPSGSGGHWFGLKAHARNLPLDADLEMHGFADGYVGLCRLGSDEVNVCGLFRHAAGTLPGTHSWQERLRGPEGSRLRARLEAAVFEPQSFCSVAGLSLRAQRAVEQKDCRIGDALTLIPPVTGNGMSMAFESAELAVEPLAAWSRGEVGWFRAQELLAATCDRLFARRLAWARGLQALMFVPALQRAPGAWALRWDWLWRLLFTCTR